MAHLIYVIALLFNFSGVQKEGREGERDEERGGQVFKGKPEI